MHANAQMSGNESIFKSDLLETNFVCDALKVLHCALTGFLILNFSHRSLAVVCRWTTRTTMRRGLSVEVGACGIPQTVGKRLNSVPEQPTSEPTCTTSSSSGETRVLQSGLTASFSSEFHVRRYNVLGPLLGLMVKRSVCGCRILSALVRYSWLLPTYPGNSE